jgi:hypothetical protein
VSHETVRHWAIYLEHRAERKLARSQATATARMVLTTLAGSALGLGVTGEVTEQVPGALDQAAAVRALSQGITG